MARYTGPVCRLCRREGMKLFLKGARCISEKCAAARRAYPPGQHGRSRRVKFSNYALQLREKQKVRRIYGITEHQFRLYFQRAEKARGVTGTVLLQLLERRLDNIAFRLGFASSRAEGRQIVKHSFILVNSKPVNIPSYSVRTNDTISIKNNEKKRKLIQENIKLNKERTVPGWLGLKREDPQGVVKKLPEREDVQFPIREQLIVELYSK